MMAVMGCCVLGHAAPVVGHGVVLAVPHRARMIAMPHVRHRQRRQNPVQGKRQGQQQMEGAAEHDPNRLRLRGKSFKFEEAKASVSPNRFSCTRS